MKAVTLARKPLERGLVETVITEGTGGLHTDALRIPLAEGETVSVGYHKPLMHDGWKRDWMDDPERWKAYKDKAISATNTLGRWPPNFIVVRPAGLPGALLRFVKVVP